MLSRGWAAMLLSWSLAVSASAQDDLGRARAAFERAAFGEAVEAYDAAAGGDGLSRDELLVLLRGRALARHANRDAAGAEADLVALLSLEPEAELGDEAPPSLHRALSRLRGEVAAPVSIEAEASRIPDGFELRARPREDVAELVRHVRIAWHDGDTWQSADGPSARVVAGPSLRWYAEAIGPGGAVVASFGRQDEPRTATAPGAAPGRGSTADPMSPSSDDTALHVGIGVGVGVAVAAVVAIVLAVLLAPQGGTQPTGPMEVTP